MATKMASVTQLTVHERKRLKTLESAIRSHLSGFLEVGKALQEVREKKLHRETHLDFERYAFDRFGLKKARIYQLMDAVEVEENTSTNGGPSVIENERQAREFSQFSPEFQKGLASEIREIKPSLNGKVSALAISEKAYQLGRTMFERLSPKDKQAVAKLAQKRHISRQATIGREKLIEEIMGYLEKAKARIKRLGNKDALDLCQTLMESISQE